MSIGDVTNSGKPLSLSMDDSLRSTTSSSPRGVDSIDAVAFEALVDATLGKRKSTENAKLFDSITLIANTPKAKAKAKIDLGVKNLLVRAEASQAKTIGDKIYRAFGYDFNAEEIDTENAEQKMAAYLKGNYTKDLKSKANDTATSFMKATSKQVKAALTDEKISEIKSVVSNDTVETLIANIKSKGDFNSIYILTKMLKDAGQLDVAPAEMQVLDEMMQSIQTNYKYISDLSLDNDYPVDLNADGTVKTDGLTGQEMATMSFALQMDAEVKGEYNDLRITHNKDYQAEVAKDVLASDQLHMMMRAQTDSQVLMQQFIDQAVIGEVLMPGLESQGVIINEGTVVPSTGSENNPVMNARKASEVLDDTLKVFKQGKDYSLTATEASVLNALLRAGKPFTEENLVAGLSKKGIKKGISGYFTTLDKLVNDPDYIKLNSNPKAQQKFISGQIDSEGRTTKHMSSGRVQVLAVQEQIDAKIAELSAIADPTATDTMFLEMLQDAKEKIPAMMEALVNDLKDGMGINAIVTAADKEFETVTGDERPSVINRAVEQAKHDAAHLAKIKESNATLASAIKELKTIDQQIAVLQSGIDTSSALDESRLGSIEDALSGAHSYFSDSASKQVEIADLQEQRKAVLAKRNEAEFALQSTVKEVQAERAALSTKFEDSFKVEMGFRKEPIITADGAVALLEEGATIAEIKESTILAIADLKSEVKENTDPKTYSFYSQSLHNLEHNLRLIELAEGKVQEEKGKLLATIQGKKAELGSLHTSMLIAEANLVGIQERKERFLEKGVMSSAHGNRGAMAIIVEEAQAKEKLKVAQAEVAKLREEIEATENQVLQLAASGVTKIEKIADELKAQYKSDEVGEIFKGTTPEGTPFNFVTSPTVDTVIVDPSKSKLVPQMFSSWVSEGAIKAQEKVAKTLTSAKDQRDESKSQTDKRDAISKEARTAHTTAMTHTKVIKSLMAGAQGTEIAEALAFTMKQNKRREDEASKAAIDDMREIASLKGRVSNLKQALVEEYDRFEGTLFLVTTLAKGKLGLKEDIISAQQNSLSNLKERITEARTTIRSQRGSLEEQAATIEALRDEVSDLNSQLEEALKRSPTEKIGSLVGRVGTAITGIELPK